MWPTSHHSSLSSVSALGWPCLQNNNIFRREARAAAPQGTFATPNLRKMADNTLYTQVRTMENHDDSVWDLAVTKEYVYSAGYDGKISEWDVNNGNLMHTFNVKDGEVGHDKQIWSCANDETRKLLLSVGNDLRMCGWDISLSDPLASSLAFTCNTFRSKYSFMKSSTLIFPKSNDSSLYPGYETAESCSP